MLQSSLTCPVSRAYEGNGYNHIQDSMICAGLPEGGKDSCQVFIYTDILSRYAYIYIFVTRGRATAAAPSCAGARAWVS